MARTARLSGLQRDVLSLYRRCLRAARLKPAANRPNFEAFARREFARYLPLDKKDFGAIEFLLRKGQKQLEVSPPKPVELEISTPQAILNINKLKKNSRQSESGHQIWAPFRTEHNSHGSEQ
ncbi:hypothetical protein Q7P36_005023 [Cladosporium allicinum]